MADQTPLPLTVTLAGKRVAITRAESQSAALAAALRAGGAATHGAMALRFFDQD